ncbi:MAG: hypothetical protein F4Z25_00935 [Chloroflexi bacterium]|nr:hypothetical protein [Chloroflexota bacterium]
MPPHRQSPRADGARRPARRRERLVSVRLAALFVATPGGEQRLREVLESDARSTQSEEGAERFELFVSAEDARRLVLIEQWRSQEDLDAHKLSDHRNETHAALHGEDILEDLEIWICEPRDGPA